MRALNASDVDLVTRHREEMFREMDFAEEDLAAMTVNFRPWLEPRLVDGRYFGWVIEEDGKPVAGIGLIVLDWRPPHPYNPAGTPGTYVLNVFVEREYRGKGLATELMKVAQEESARRGFRFMTLHASAFGRPLYEKLGWKQTNEMSFICPGA